MRTATEDYQARRTMKKNKIYIAATLLLAGWTNGQAQVQVQDTTLNRTVVVEQEYAPDIMSASKINVLPQVEAPTATKHTVEYDASLRPATYIPATAMPSYMGKETQPEPLPGYLRFGYGNNGNLDVYANYLFLLSERDKLNINFSLNGMDGELDLPDGAETWNSYHYRTRASLDYTHRFKAVDLKAEGNFGLSYFNLLYGKQRFTSGDVRLGIVATDKNLPVQFQAETALMYYDHSYNRQDASLNEIYIRTQGELYIPIKKGGQAGMAFRMNNLFYDYAQKPLAATKENDQTSYTTVDLNPYYQTGSDKWSLHLGVRADLASKGKNNFLFAPDVLMTITTGNNSKIYIRAEGGRHLNDFRRLEQIAPYAPIYNAYFTSSYEQLNAAAGFKWGTDLGFKMHLYGGYRIMKDELTPYLTETVGGEPWKGHALQQADTKNFYTGAELGYDYKDIFSLQGSLLYRSWEEDELYFYFLPEMVLDLHADVRPITGLQFRLGYQGITRRGSGLINDGKKAPAVGNLYFNGHYDLFHNLGIYVRAENLLDKEYQYYWGYPAQGLNFLGGLTFRF